MGDVHNKISNLREGEFFYIFMDTPYHLDGGSREMMSEEWETLGVQTYGLPPDLIVPIAAADLEAIETYVGTIRMRILSCGTSICNCTRSRDRYIPCSGLKLEKIMISKACQYCFCDYTYLEPFEFTGAEQCETFQFFPEGSWCLRVALLLFECFDRYCYPPMWRCLYL